VILTGGDPLALSARRLLGLSERLRDVGHVAVLRLHTRVPTAAPDLVTREKLAALTASGKAVYMALHVNHARELTPQARDAIARIQQAGVATLAQTVLLRGVNDDADTLEQLMRALTALRVKPYYLHHPDLAPGTSHFRVSIEDGRALHAELARRISGVALPAYVLDIPGGHGKVPLQRPHLERSPDGGWLVRDRSGRAHAYRDDSAD
jgi:lysine 2,3-aminomutase